MSDERHRATTTVGETSGEPGDPLKSDSPDERPPFDHRATAVGETSGEPADPLKSDSPDERPPFDHRAITAVGQTNGEPDGPEAQPKGESPMPDDSPSPLARPSYVDIFLLFCIFVMLVWPWIFFGVVWSRHGLQMHNSVARAVDSNPHAVTYVISLICSIISMFVSALFSFAIIRFAQEMVTRQDTTHPFHLRVLSGLRHRTWPWGTNWEDVLHLAKGGRWLAAILVILCLCIFPNLVSTTTSLLTPIPFNRTATLIGTELDFSSTDTACLDWFKAHPKSNNCDWQGYKDQNYTSCLGENQMVDVLEAGRGNILEFISNNTQSLTFSQLGGKDGLHFLGSIRGVLPMGPNGVPAFDTLQPSPFSDPEKVEGMKLYDYTLGHQGVASNISCSYETTSLIRYMVSTSNDTVSYTGTCTSIGQTLVLAGVPFFRSIYGNNTLMYWACQSPPSATQPPSYTVYLRGVNNGYENMGNVTCTVSPMHPATFPVMYESTTRIFSAGNPLPVNEPATYSPSAFSLLANYSFIGLGGVIEQGQNFDSNLVAESVITYGVKSFGLQPYERSSTYLRLYERMIQGILEYQTTYVRLIYSTVPDPPHSCNRDVNGSVNYEVLGWYVTTDNIGYLIPLTVINLASFIVLLLTVIFAKHKDYLPALHPRPVKYDPKYREEVPDEWKERVAFRPTSILKAHFEDVQSTAVDVGLSAAKDVVA